MRRGLARSIQSLFRSWINRSAVHPRANKFLTRLLFFLSIYIYIFIKRTMNAISVSWFHFHYPVPWPPGMIITSCSCSNECNWGNSCVRFNFEKSQTLKKFLLKFQIEKDILTVMICASIYMRLRKNEGMLKIRTYFLPNLQVLRQDQCLFLHIMTAPASRFVTFTRPEQVALYD